MSTKRIGILTALIGLILGPAAAAGSRVADRGRPVPAPPPAAPAPARPESTPPPAPRPDASRPADASTAPVESAERAAKIAHRLRERRAERDVEELVLLIGAEEVRAAQLLLASAHQQAMEIMSRNQASARPTGGETAAAASTDVEMNELRALRQRVHAGLDQLARSVLAKLTPQQVFTLDRRAAALGYESSGDPVIHRITAMLTMAKTGPIVDMHRGPDIRAGAGAQPVRMPQQN